MASQLTTFLKSVKTRVESVLNGADPAFLRVWVAPFLDVERMLLIPRWPAAVIFDNGGTLDARNGKIWTREFSIAVVTCKPLDHIGEESTFEILDLGELLVNEMEYDTDNSVFNAGEAELETIGVDSNLLVLVKTYRFTAQFERA